MTTLRIWTCTRDGCDESGVRAPGRMRADDVRRYCLPCSTESGRLVARVCPALERKRGASAEARKEKRAAAYRREVSQNCLDCGFDVVKAFDKMKRFPHWKTEHERAARILRSAKLSLWWRGRGRGSSGRAWGSRRVHLTVARSDSRAGAGLLVLHELTHIFVSAAKLDRLPTSEGRRPHGRNFHALLLEGANVLFDGLEEHRREVLTRYKGFGGSERAYSMDHAIEVVVRLHEIGSPRMEVCVRDHVATGPRPYEVTS